MKKFNLSKYSLNNFHDRLKYLVGENVSAWSKKIGYSEQAVSKWLDGSNPGVDKVISICETLEVQSRSSFF